MRVPSHDEKGIALIALAVSLALLVPILGLSVDGGLLWAANNRLNSACDAAALATARSLGAGAALPDQIAYATNRGEAFFQANFDSAQFGGAHVVPVINVAEIAPAVLEITATAKANIAVYFMRYLGPGVSLVQASGRVIRRDVDLVIALDTSAGPFCEEAVRQSKLFANSFMAGRDRIGLVVNGQPILDPDPRFKIGGMMGAKLDAVSCGDAAGGVPFAAYDQISKLNRPEALNAVVWISGKPSEPNSNPPVRTYVIGPAAAPEIEKRLRLFSNDAREPNPDTGRPVGMFLQTGESSQLAQAYSTILNDLMSSGR